MSILKQSQRQNGNSQDLFNVSNILGVGVYQAPIYVFDCIPQIISTSTLQIVALNSPQANKPMTLVAANVKNIAGIPVPVIPLDCQRGVQIESVLDFPQNGTITFTGYDANHVQVVNTVSFTSSDETVASTKTFKYISSVVSSIALFNIEVFPTYLIGLPYYLTRIDDVISCTVSGAPYDTDNITTGNNWRLEAPTATTEDARGTVFLESNVPLTVCYHCYGADSFLQAQLLTAEADGQTNDSSQKIIYANASANPIVSVPVLIPFDETGVQYPTEMTEYNKLPTS